MHCEYKSHNVITGIYKPLNVYSLCCEYKVTKCEQLNINLLNVYPLYCEYKCTKCEQLKYQYKATKCISTVLWI